MRNGAVGLALIGGSRAADTLAWSHAHRVLPESKTEKRSQRKLMEDWGAARPWRSLTASPALFSAPTLSFRPPQLPASGRAVSDADRGQSGPQ
jgi:hypothetical protein